MTVPSSFRPLTVPLPPMLLDMAGVTSSSRFVALYYNSSNPNWSDGRSLATFPFYLVWQPYIEHIAIAIELFDCNLGADDEVATHTLVCDREREQVYVAPFTGAMSLVDKQHPDGGQEITLEQWEELKAQLENQPPLSMSQMQDLGMFEMFAPNSEHKDRVIELIRWLDCYINEALMRKYVVAAKAGDNRAAWVLETFIKRRSQHQ